MSIGTGEGAAIIAEAFKKYGIEYCFGIVGFPVIEVGMAIQTVGINYIGCRNEQTASYAASTVGYLTQNPGLCLVVSGPGVVHALAGLQNALINNWPLVVIGGSSDSNQSQMMAFQESSQIEMVRPHVKYAARIDSIERAPFHIERAIRLSVSGRPGPVYLDLPGDLVNKAPTRTVEYPLIPDYTIPTFKADEKQIDRAVAQLALAERPLIIVGEGASYYNCSDILIKLVEESGIPFITAPMGKGVIPDDHPQNVIAARSTALKEADVIVLVSTRLNWMLHFGKPPRFDKDVKIIQIDIDPNTMNDNVPSLATLVGTPNLVLEQLYDKLIINENTLFKPLEAELPWWVKLAEVVQGNVKVSIDLYNNRDLPMNYYAPIYLLQQVLEKDYRDAIIVSEGASTMDIGRTILDNYEPKKRLDAAVYGTMGLALGHAMAAQAVSPDKKVVCLLGDSSFGFSGMEIETLARYKMPVVIVIINNSGIAMGAPIGGDTMQERFQESPVTSLGTGGETHYEKMIEAFGGKGYYCTKHDEIQPAFRDALQLTDRPSIINIIIDPFTGRKKQKFTWLTREDASAKSKL